MRRRRASIFRIGVPKGTFAKVFRRSSVSFIPTDFDHTNPLLCWSPPALVNPTTITIGTGFFGATTTAWVNTSGNGRPNGPRAFADDEDVVLTMPGSMRNVNSDFETVGGRNIVLKGGHARGRMMFKDITGSLYVEGLRIDMAGAANKDAINAYGKTGFTPDITLQNIHVSGVQGTFAGVHADVFQPQGPIGKLRIDKMTFDSNYQGIFARPQFAIESAEIFRINGKFNALGTSAGNTELLWLRNGFGEAGHEPSFLYHVNLDEVYIQANTTSPTRAAVYPPPGVSTAGEPSAGAYAGVVNGSGDVSWPEGSNIRGSVKRGNPAVGDFVPAANVGLGYVPATQWQDAMPKITYLAILGNGRVGSVHSAEIYTEGNPVPSIAYQWRRNGIDIAGATTSSYIPVAADDGTTLTVSAVASNASGSTPPNISAGRAITYALPEITSAGVLNRALIGLSSNVTGFAFTGVGTLSYQWYADGVPTAGATNATRTPSEAANGKQITRRTTVANSGGSVFADTPPLTATYQPPAAGAALAARSFSRDTGVQTFATAAGFSVPGDTDLSGVLFSLISPPGGVTINATTGFVSVDTSSALAPTTITVRATNSGGSLNRTFSLEVVGPALNLAPARSLNMRIGWTGHSMLDDKFVVGTNGIYVSSPMENAVIALGGAPTYNHETVPGTSAKHRYDASGTFGKDPLVSMMQTEPFDVFVGIEGHGGSPGPDWNSVQAAIDYSDGLNYAYLWHSLAVEAGCEAIFYQNFHCGTWSKSGQTAYETPAQWRARQDTEIAKEQSLRDYVNVRKEAGTPPLRTIPILELVIRVYDDIQAGILTGVTMDDFFSDNVHFSALGAWMSQAACYACIYNRNPSDFPILADYANTNFYPEMLPRPTAAICDQLRPIIWDVVTNDPRTGIVVQEEEGEWSVSTATNSITFASIPPTLRPSATGGENSVTFGA